MSAKLNVDANELTGELRDAYRSFFFYWNARRPISVTLAARNDDGTLRDLTDFETASFIDHLSNHTAHHVALLDEAIAQFAVEVLGLEAG